MRKTWLTIAFIGLSSITFNTNASDNKAKAEAEEVDCSYDRDVMMALDQDSFDQDVNGGWRPLGKEGCYGVAANLILDYRNTHGIEDKTLIWHEGQMRAMNGENELAVELFKQSYDKKDSEAAQAWNYYVDATIAFLQKDKEALLKARASLAKVPKPEGFPPQMTWPMNIEFVDSFISCFGREYKDAYGQCD